MLCRRGFETRTALFIDLAVLPFILGWTVDHLRAGSATRDGTGDRNQ